MKQKKLIPALVAVIAFWGAGSAWAGPVILGGDDLTDHGSRLGGANLEGWLYIQKAIDNLLTSQSRPGTLTTDIAALGSAANPAFTSSNAGGAIGSAADVLGKTVTFFDTAAVINQFFTDLAGGLVNPAVIWLAGTGANNDLDGLEGAALTANAAAINTFVASGGGLMAHGSGSTAYGWLSALLPGISEVGGCSSTGATLTPAGLAAFPGLTNANIDGNAGPCHSHFEGNFGGLTTLALDAQDLSYIIGGGGGTVIQCGQPGQAPCPQTQVPEPEMLPLAALGIGALALVGRIRRRRPC
jgi:hypothetical protein